MEERIQKILAAAGYGSRRACEELIIAGRVTVNGQPVHSRLKSRCPKGSDQAGWQIDQTARSISIYRLIQTQGGFVCRHRSDPTPDRRGFGTGQGTFYPVGRLDVDSEGLILLTNDGDLANQLTHPRYGMRRNTAFLSSSSR